MKRNIPIGLKSIPSCNETTPIKTINAKMYVVSFKASSSPGLDRIADPTSAENKVKSMNFGTIGIGTNAIKINNMVLMRYKAMSR